MRFIRLAALVAALVIISACPAQAGPRHDPAPGFVPVELAARQHVDELARGLLAGLARPGVDPTGKYPVGGVDVSSWQHPGGAAIDWARVRAAGLQFATVKATEGSAADSTDYTNPWFRGDLDGARAAGVPVAPFHFYLARHPDTGAAQASHFIAALRAAGYTGHRPGDLPPILDYEWDWKPPSCPPYATVADARAWLDRVQAAFGRRPIIYTNRYFFTNCLGGTTALADYPLQTADYSNPTPGLPPGWSTWLMWQWTSHSHVDGVPTDSLTRSVFNGDRAALLSLANMH